MGVDAESFDSISSNKRPFQAVTDRFNPLQIVSSRYKPLQAVTGRYRPTALFRQALVTGGRAARAAGQASSCAAAGHADTGCQSDMQTRAASPTGTNQIGPYIHRPGPASIRPGALGPQYSSRPQPACFCSARAETGRNRRSVMKPCPRDCFFLSGRKVGSRCH